MDAYHFNNEWLIAHEMKNIKVTTEIFLLVGIYVYLSTGLFYLYRASQTRLIQRNFIRTCPHYVMNMVHTYYQYMIGIFYFCLILK